MKNKPSSTNYECEKEKNEVIQPCNLFHICIKLDNSESFRITSLSVHKRPICIHESCIMQFFFKFKEKKNGMIVWPVNFRKQDIQFHRRNQSFR